MPHSCNFNSIEKLWSVAKNNLMKLLLLRSEPIDEPEFAEIVRRSLEIIPPQTVTALVNSNRAYIEAVLTEAD